MNRYTASGNPSDRPEKPRCRFPGSNGFRLMLPECWMSSAIATTIRSNASNPKKIAATVVDGFAPAMIR
jgi:hypothetical protein